jgi:diguanylate cyclase (GGDEF)-like protein
MTTFSSIVSFILLLSTLTSIFAMVMVWRRRPILGYRAWIIYLMGAGFWSGTYAIFWLNLFPQLKQFWLDLTYLGVVIVPGAVLIFICEYLGYSRWVRKQWYLFLVEPIITLAILWTDPIHHLFYGIYRDPNQSQIYNGGIWFWVNVIYSYVLIFCAILILILGLIRRSELAKNQTRMILIGLSFPVIGNILSFIGLTPLRGVDITPILFGATGVTVAFAMVFYHLFDLVPIGREVLVEHMQEGMFLFNSDERLMDINPAAVRLLNLPSQSQIGMSAGQMLANFPQILPLLHHPEINSSLELHLSEPEEKYLNFRAEAVRDQVVGVVGVLITCRDVTDQKKAEINLMDRYNEISLLQASLSEQAIRDPLTGLYNRRYLHETLPREIAQANRENKSMCIVMLDLDHFKDLNDTYGHPVGDLVLKELSKYLLKNIRAGDIAVRYGGEEFLVVLINTPLDIAFLRVETWRIDFQARLIHAGSEHVSSTFSAGIASFPSHGTRVETLINNADIALYQSKAGGRNMTTIFSTPEQ